MIGKDTCIPTSNEALFAIAKTQEAASMSISRGENKEDVVHLYKGILLSHQKE